jgi:hypothetical protein
MNRNDDLLRQGLRRYAGQIAAAHTPPPAAGIWLMAERRRRKLAVRRAAMPLRIMQAVGVLCAIAAAVWLLRGSGASGTSLLSAAETMGTAAVVIASASILLVVAGCWTMLAAGRRLTS